MGIENIEAVYPVGRLDKSLLLVGGNKRMYDFMGEYIYTPLYKRVLERDVDRLKAAVARCDARETEDVEECVHILNEDGKYDVFIVILRKIKNFEGYEIELQNVSANIRQIEQIGSDLSILRDYLTVSGNVLFSYRPSDGWFELFWLDYEQQVDICSMPFDQWRDRMIREGQVSRRDLAVFKSFCKSVRSADREQTYTFRGSILTWGKTEDTYRVRFLPRLCIGQKRILGVWSIINGQTGNAVDDYIEGTYLDAMTRVMNKKGITEYAESKVASGAKVAVIMMDIDNFKNVNDTYGHPFGDTVITAVADIIKKVIGEHGVAGRVGGDEFLVILDNQGDELMLRNYLRGIKMNVNALFLEKVGDNKISCSIGVSRSPLDSADFKELYQIADKALYLAKQKGKNRYIIYKPELHGTLHLGEGTADMSDIREAFYSDRDLLAFNQSLGELVLKGREELPRLLEKLARILTVPRVLVFWGENRELIGACPQSLLAENYDKSFFEREEYIRLFQNDMLQIGNMYMLEYTMPETYRMYREKDIYSILQYCLRDEEGNIRGFVSVEERSQIRGFPKLAVQIFESMCRVLSSVLQREAADEMNSNQKALDN